jgi:hypothetical protein
VKTKEERIEEHDMRLEREGTKPDCGRLIRNAGKGSDF